MGFGKTVTAEAFDLLENLCGEVCGIAFFLHPRCQAFLVRFEPAVAFPRGHGAAQLIRFAGAVVGGDNRDLHHLFLEQRDAEGTLQHLPQLF
ncbi:hypothetical protein D3C85_730490 [compost metagenome]